MSTPSTRTIGLGGATAVGVGAIVGGGILALAGVALARTGPGAIVAFALNGLIAVVTALSFAEMSARFPESGGAYTFAKKVLTVEAAFCVGWVVWFASIVAAVLYAVGFAAFAVVVVDEVWRAVSDAAPVGLHDRPIAVAFAMGGTALLTIVLIFRGGTGGSWINVVKVLVFAVLIAGGLWVLIGSPAGTIRRTMTPFFPGGSMGLIQAMGFTFIALQGFDLIAAVAGEIRDPQRNVPRAMLFALGIALLIYLPLLLVVSTVGVGPDETIAAASAENPETILALAARRFLGPFGYWLVLVAGVLSMLSALQANLYAASRVALAMARDRTLPRALERLRGARRTPLNATLATTALVALIILVLPDVAAAGAAASLIFLITFTIVQAIGMLARRRAGPAPIAFRVPWYPALPAAGALACVALAAFQGFAVPAAGRIAVVWLSIGGLLFLLLFGRRARIRDEASQAADPEMLMLRGRSPLVLVPVANPARAEAMVDVAHMLVPPGYGRVLLMSVVTVEANAAEITEPLVAAQTVLGRAFVASYAAGRSPEAVTTVATEPWSEIARIARARSCRSVLLGLSDLADGTTSPLDRLMGGLESDVVVLRSPPNWHVAEARRVLVPVAGRSHHDVLRARLLGSLSRTGEREIVYLRIVPGNATSERYDRVHRVVERIAEDETHGRAKVELIRSDDPAAAIVARAAESDLVILGLQRHTRRRKVLGSLTTRIARETEKAMLLISRRG